MVEPKRVPKERGKGIENDTEAAKRANEYAKNKLKGYLEGQIELTQKKIMDIIKDINEQEISLDSIKKGMKESMSDEDYNNASKAIDKLNKSLNDLLNDHDTLDGLLKDLENKSFDDIETDIGADPNNKPTPAEKASLNKWLENQLSKIVDLVQKVSPDLRNKINNLKLKFDPTKNTSDQLSDLENAIKDLEKSVDENSEKNYEINLAKATLEKLKKEGIPEIKDSRPRSSLAENLKAIVKLLAVLGSIGGLIWFAVDYITKHSGCNRIYQESNDRPLLCDPVKCVTEDNGTIINFSNIQCNKKNCNKDPNKDPKGWVCNSTTCPVSSSAEHPNPIDCGNTICQNVDLMNEPINFYEIKIYGPWDIFVDLANDAADAAGNTFDWIKNLLIWGGIGFAIIIGILIIYKVVEHFLNKSSESVPTINIKTIPGTQMTKIPKVSFGDRNILGNLSKYRNYGYMGRCNYKYPV